MHQAKRIPFTESEDQIIRGMVSKYGENWERVSTKLCKRSPKQCHDRYINYLQDGLRIDPWSEDEDELLIKLYLEIGSKWSKMTKLLPGRSGNDIKNRWHKHLSKGFMYIDDGDKFEDNSSLIKDVIGNLRKKKVKTDKNKDGDKDKRENAQILIPNKVTIKDCQPQIINDWQIDHHEEENVNRINLCAEIGLSEFEILGFFEKTCLFEDIFI